METEADYNVERKRKMSRESSNEYDSNNRLINGYDYKNQAWVENGKYVRCGHPDNTKCSCYGRMREGEKTISDDEV